MQQFILNSNQQANGDYEVHNASTSCSWMPQIWNRIDLGYHMDCRGAVATAKANNPHLHRINGCAYCCPVCHTS